MKKTLEIKCNHFRPMIDASCTFSTVDQFIDGLKYHFFFLRESIEMVLKEKELTYHLIPAIQIYHISVDEIRIHLLAYYGKHPPGCTCSFLEGMYESDDDCPYHNISNSFPVLSNQKVWYS